MVADPGAPPKQCGANENKWVLDENCTELDGDDTHEPPWSDEEDDGD